MLHIVRNVINFTKAYGNKIKMKAGQTVPLVSTFIYCV